MAKEEFRGDISYLNSRLIVAKVINLVALYLTYIERRLFWPEAANVFTHFCRISPDSSNLCMCLTQQFLHLLELTVNGHLLQVIINFPDPAHKSDIVQLRGPKNEVEKCTKYMQKMVADLVRGTSVCCSLLRAWITEIKQSCTGLARAETSQHEGAVDASGWMVVGWGVILVI